MILRLLLLALVVGSGFLAVAALERRRPPGWTLPGATAGVTLVTSAGCAICPAAVRAIAAAGPDVTVRVVDAGDLADPAIRSIPTAIVTDQAGKVVLRRSGRSVVADAAQIVGAARGVA